MAIIRKGNRVIHVPDVNENTHIHPEVKLTKEDEPVMTLAPRDDPISVYDPEISVVKEVKRSEEVARFWYPDIVICGSMGSGSAMGELRRGYR